MGVFGGLGLIFYTLFIILIALFIYDRRNSCHGRDLDRIRPFIQPGLDFLKPKENLQQ